MSQLQRNLIIIIAILLALVIAFDAALLNAIYFAPDRLDVNYETIHDTNIPYSMDDVSIVYFTDLQYGKYENKERADHLFSQIRELNPDILIFGGDLLDTNTNIDNKTQKYLTKQLSSIKAPLGKFAVWGEKDRTNTVRKKKLETIYQKSQIEILDNTSVSLSNQSSAHIKLIGLTSKSGIPKATEDVSSKSYNLLVTHQPDTLLSNQLADSGISLALAGHSHGTQITYPVLGAYKTISGAKKLNRDKAQDLEFDYIISSGVGCTHVNIRFNANPEINYFILNHD